MKKNYRQSTEIIDIRKADTDPKQMGEANKLDMMTRYLLKTKDGVSSRQTDKKPLAKQSDPATKNINEYMHSRMSNPKGAMQMARIAKNRKLDARPQFLEPYKVKIK